jgi:hypothetical protein
VREQPVAEIPEQAVCLEVEIGDDEIGAAVSVVVARVDAHARPRLAVGRDGDAGAKRRLYETESVHVAEQKVWDAVVGDIDVRPGVAVVVGDDDPEAVAAIGGDA